MVIKVFSEKAFFICPLEPLDFRSSYCLEAASEMSVLKGCLYFNLKYTIFSMSFISLSSESRG